MPPGGKIILIAYQQMCCECIIIFGIEEISLGIIEKRTATINNTDMPWGM